MKISAFTMILNPDYWCFPYQEALQNWSELFDEIIIVDGGSTDGSLEKIKQISDKIKIIYLKWPWDYKQREFPLHYNFGLKNCTGDWAFKMDIDWLIHETDFKEFRNKFKEWKTDNPKIMAISLQKMSMLNRFQYQYKGRMVLGINKRCYDNKIAMGIIKGNETKCDWTNIIEIKGQKDSVPYGNLINNKNIIDFGIPFYNYDCFFRTEEKCKEWYKRAARAYLNETNYPLYGNGDDDSWKMWKNMMRWRLIKIHPHKMKIGHHPKHIQDKLKQMTPICWGHSNFGWQLD